jgi:DNA replication protein DnaC
MSEVVKIDQIIKNNYQHFKKYLPPEDMVFKIVNAKKIFREIFEYVLPGFQMLPEYKEVISWIEDNKGKGLFMIGSNGRGKTLIAKYIIPLIFIVEHKKFLPIVNAQKMNSDLDFLLNKKILVIDDIGIEEQKIVYGERRWAFPELLDNAEKEKNILILTSNLDADAIHKKYGIRTRDRVKTVCKVVVFKGESLRK